MYSRYMLWITLYFLRFSLCLVNNSVYIHHGLNAVTTNIEFQKWGLPDAHIALFFYLVDKIRDTKWINRCISTELPEKDRDPVWFEVVSVHMMHGLCDRNNQRSPCMSNSRCIRHYLHKLQQETLISYTGYLTYHRREMNSFVVKNKVKMDSTYANTCIREPKNLQ